MDPQSLTEKLKKEAHRLGFDLAGATAAVTPPAVEQLERWLAAGYAAAMHYMADRAEAYRHPRSVLDGVRSILMLAVNYRTVQPSETGPGQAKLSRYAWGADYHDLVGDRLAQLADFHRRIVPHARVRGVLDTVPLLEREFARLAGLGWIGKNTLLLNRQFGSWVFLAALLTTELLEYDRPYEQSHCGTCRACLDACPSGALVEPYRLDARKCVSYLTIELRGPIPTELRPHLGDRLFGCDICQEVCPWNRRTPEAEEESFLPGQDMNPLEPAGLFKLDDAAFRKRFRRTPLRRAKRRGILRNAAVVLGNRPHAAALPGLASGLQDAEPSVRAACAWALGRYGSQAALDLLRERLSAEADPEARAEIEAAIGRR